jgi:opacity protein-like surface antigen
MNKKWLVAMLGAAAMTMSVGAIAQQRTSGFYVGGDIGTVDFGSDDDTGFRIFGGYQINRTFSAELGYATLYDKGGVDVTAWELVGLGSLPIANQFSVFGKLGLAMWEVKGFGAKRDGTDLTFGVGLQYDLSRNVGIRAQWQRYDTDPEEADALTIGLVYRF